MTSHERLGVRRPGIRTESKLFNAARPTATLLVEGGSDERFWRMHSHPRCLVRHQGQGGRQAALDQLRRPADPEVALVAVLDADLDRVEGRVQDLPGVVWTDAHDLETTLLGLPTLEKVAREALGPAQIAEQEARWAETLRDRLFRHATGMGRLRWLKQREGLPIVFRKDERLFDAYEACASDDWAPSLSAVIRKVTDYSNAQRLDRHDLAARVEALPAADIDQVCNGHDLLGFLHTLLRPKRSPALSLDELTRRVAISCESGWLEQTAMWKALRTWEDAHPGFAVLRPA